MRDRVIEQTTQDRHRNECYLVLRQFGSSLSFLKMLNL